MSITTDKLDIIIQEKQNIKNAIIGKGATVTDSLASFAPAIDSIQTGGKIEPKKTIDITQNGTTNIVPSAGFDGIEGVDVNVDVPIEKNPKHIKIYDGVTFGNSTWTTFPWTSWDISEVMDMSYMFYNCSALTTVPQFDTSNVTNMGSMFDYCKALTTVPQFDTSNVTNMDSMFSSCKALTTVPQFDTSKVTNMRYMFNYCEALTTVPQFDTSNVTNMGSMFSYCKALTTVPQFDTSKVTDMSYMFDYCKALTTVPLFDTSKVTDMSYMFRFCDSLTTVPELDISNVTNMNNMFDGCKNIKEVRFKSSNRGRGISCTDMFKGITTTGTLYLKNDGGYYNNIINVKPSSWTVVRY